MKHSIRGNFEDFLLEAFTRQVLPTIRTQVFYHKHGREKIEELLQKRMKKVYEFCNYQIKRTGEKWPNQGDFCCYMMIINPTDHIKNIEKFYIKFVI